MGRVVISRVNNHQIDRDALVGLAAAVLKRADDIVAVLPDGQTAGKKIEDTVPHAEWPNPDTGLPMKVNDKFWIIQIDNTPPGHADLVDLLEEETEPDPADPTGQQRRLVQKKKKKLRRTGTGEDKLTPSELVQLESFGFLDLVPGRSDRIFGDR